MSTVPEHIEALRERAEKLRRIAVNTGNPWPDHLSLQEDRLFQSLAVIMCSVHLDELEALARKDHSRMEEGTGALPDSLYPNSKGWLESNYAQRVEWLHVMYESAKKERDEYLRQLTAVQSAAPFQASIPDDASPAVRKAIRRFNNVLASRHAPNPDCECHDCHIARTRTFPAATPIPPGECTAPDCDCEPGWCRQRAPATFTPTRGPAGWLEWCDGEWKYHHNTIYTVGAPKNTTVRIALYAAPSQKMAAAGYTPRKSGRTAGGLMREDADGVKVDAPSREQAREALRTILLMGHFPEDDANFPCVRTLRQFIEQQPARGVTAGDETQALGLLRRLVEWDEGGRVRNLSTFLKEARGVLSHGVTGDRPNDPHDDLTPGADSTDRAGVTAVATVQGPPHVMDIAAKLRENGLGDLDLSREQWEGIYATVQHFSAPAAGVKGKAE